MGTITIASKKSEDLYFLSELARRMGMKSKIKVDKNSIGRVSNKNKEEDKRLIEMISYNGLRTIGKILENEPGDIF
ncbi:MAG: hypothetical protein K8S16_12415 [Bacteroidales bacterium]|nr:hypothetical protein [Bacteroidales bacterium]